MYDYKASDIMTKDVICVNPEMRINELDKIFVKHKITGAPVVDESENLVGVVSQSNIVNYICQYNYSDYAVLNIPSNQIS